MKKNTLILTISILFGLIIVSCSKDNNTEPHNEAPACNIISPVDSVSIEYGDSISVSVEATDDTGISEVFFYFDNSEIKVSNEFPYTCLISTSEILAGYHTIKVIALDDEGLSSIDSITVIVDKSILFPDQNLDDEIRIKVNKPTGQLFLSDVDTITVFEAHNGIYSLGGMEYCRSLEKLDLSINYLDDITPISNLTNLISLNLYWNQISDISPLANLVNLTKLDLCSNSIIDISSLENLTNLNELDLGINFGLSDISALAGMINMRKLLLDYNQINGISSLSSMAELVELNLENNAVEDLTSLTDLYSLTTLDLKDNNIIDIHPLVLNSELADGDYVDLSENHLDSNSVNIYIPELVSRGVEVVNSKK